MSTASKLLSLTKARLNEDGETLTYYRYSGSGASRVKTTKTAVGKYQPLTPTFAHDVLMEGTNFNQLENDQSDFIFAGDTDIQEGDQIQYQGCWYTVTTTAPNKIGGVAITQHCLSIRSVEQ